MHNQFQCILININMFTFYHRARQLSRFDRLPIVRIINIVIGNSLHCNKYSILCALDIFVAVVRICYQVIGSFRGVHADRCLV